MRTFYVYILSNNAQVLYIGVTSDLNGRLFEHTREREPKSFTARDNLDRLVYYEDFPTPQEAIPRRATQRVESGEKEETHPIDEPDVAKHSGTPETRDDGNTRRQLN